MHSTTAGAFDKSKLPLVFVTGGPGVGKSRLLVQLSHWLPAALTTEPATAGAGMAGGGRADTTVKAGGGGEGAAAKDSRVVVLMIKSGNGMALTEEEKKQDGSHLLACRMLYSAFCSSPGTSYDSFVRSVCGSPADVTFDDAVAMICHAHGDSNITLVLLVDEAHELCVRAEEKKKKEGSYPYVTVERISLPLNSCNPSRF